MQKAALQYRKTKSSVEGLIAPSTRFSATSSPQHFNGFNSGSNLRGVGVPVDQLPALVENWMADCIHKNGISRAADLRRTLFNGLFWFLEYKGAAQCGESELLQFFRYLQTAHLDEAGRWGCKGKKFRQPLRPITVRTYYNYIRAFFSWLVEEEYLHQSPFLHIKPTKVPTDQIQPFSTEQVNALLRAAGKTKSPHRDVALILFLLDTGARVTEVCQLRMRDLDLMEGSATITGKGNKKRTVMFGRKTTKALRAYFRYDERLADDPVFLSLRGEGAGTALTRWGVRQIVERLGVAAGIQRSRCSPHTFRHTMAVQFLTNGGNAFSLKQILGHTSLRMTNQYVYLVEADIKNQHRQFSPADNLTDNLK